VRAERGRVLPRDVDDVRQVRDHRREAISPEEPRAEDHADTAALVGDGAELRVIDVPPVLVGADDPRMADDRRPRGELGGREEAAPVEGGDTAQPPGGPRPPNEVPAKGGEPLIMAHPSAVGRIARLVRAEMAEAQVAHTPVREMVELVEVPFEGMR